MGARFFNESFHKTKSGKRATHFEIEACRGLYLERVSTLRQDVILQLGVWWVVVRSRSYFLPAGRFFEPESLQKECFAPQRASTLGKAPILQLLSRWVVVRPRSYLGRSMGRHRQFVRSTLCELLRRIVLFLFSKPQKCEQLFGALRALPITSLIFLDHFQEK